jgi:hypothetical protein
MSKLRVLSVAASLLFLATTARAQDACGIIGFVPDAVAAVFTSNLVGLFPLPEEKCEKLGITFLKACDRAVRDAAACAKAELEARLKGARPTCKGANSPESCLNDFEENVDTGLEGIDEETASAFDECEEEMLPAFVSFCMEPF